VESSKLLSVRDREETDEEEEAVVNPTRRVRRQGSRNSASFGTSQIYAPEDWDTTVVFLCKTKWGFSVSPPLR
jgi:hypothetical protein